MNIQRSGKQEKTGEIGQITFQTFQENILKEIEDTKESYNEIKERNESVKDLQVVKLRGKEVLIDKYGNFKGFKE